jgi:Rha family phage regulatory protein
MSSEAVNLVGDLRLRADGMIPVVNSRDVAEVFGKRHDHVLRDVDALIGSPDLGSLINQGVSAFRELAIFDEKANREVRCFDMTRDGFTLLVMGWTGAKAMKFKIAYIKAFNAMEIELQKPPIVQGGITAQELLAGLKEAIAPLATRFDGQDKALGRVESRVDGLAEDVACIKMRLNSGRRRIQDKAKRDHIADIFELGGRCPCCSKHAVVDTDGNRLPFTDFDHFWENSIADSSHTWLICKPCHNELTRGQVARSNRTSVFNAYQDQRSRLSARQPRLFG